MKFLPTAISKQHIYLKAAIFLTGLVTGLDSSLKQLVMQAVLFLLAMLLEPSLYLSCFRAFKKIIPFLAAYWVGATLFNTDFLMSVTFSVQLLYLILVTVWVFGRQSFEVWARDSRKLRRIKWINNVFAFAIHTVLYVNSFFAGYARIKPDGNANRLFHDLGDVYREVAAKSPQIQLQVQNILTAQPQRIPNRKYSHLLGLVFLAALALIHGV